MGFLVDKLNAYRTYTWKEVSDTILEKSDGRECKKLIVINGFVYDITDFAKKHPGGAKLISAYAGQDATDVWTAMHNDKKLVSNYMKPLLVGEVENYHKSLTDLQIDFRKLRVFAEEQGWFSAQWSFFILYLGQIWMWELLAVLTFFYFGTGWPSYILATMFLVTSQAQAGWSQHDFGHLSCFNSRQLNHLVHEVVIGHLKGASSKWWNFRHFLHHSKPNVIRVDPDIDLPYVFLLGKSLPAKWGRLRRGFMPYNWQHHYFWLVGPPFLLPVYFHFEVLYFTFKRRDLSGFFWTVSFFLKFFFMFDPFLNSWWSTFALYMLVRFLESYWFTMVTQMNHLAQDVEPDQPRRDWTSTQLNATINVNPSLFNDWFTGHLNFQIEHHLFPTMPRHNYRKVQPFVKELCSKHGLQYVEKSLLTAFANIIRGLRISGRIWYEAYNTTG